MNVQVSIQGGSLLNKTFPLVYTGGAIELTLAKFQTLDNLERMSLRYNLHLHYFGSALLNRLAHTLASGEPVRKLTKLNLGELRAALGS